MEQTAFQPSRTTCIATINEMMTSEESEHIDIATKLLNSHDLKVAAAAQRIFSPKLSLSSQFTQMHQETESKEQITMVPVNTGVSVVSDPERLGLIATSAVGPAGNISRPLTSSFQLQNQVPDVVNLSFDSAPMDNLVHESPFNMLNKVLRGENEFSKKHASPHERLARSRERNKIHARKTRQRKKVHMQVLEKKAVDLKQTQISLKLRINEKNTASILMAMISTEVTPNVKKTAKDGRIEDLLKRPSECIPEASKIPELPALLLPGHHNNRKREYSSVYCKKPVADGHEPPCDDIDYDLLARDRSTCTSTELDKIRRERNRMHAKRTRDRKRRFHDEMDRIIRQLEDENELLCDHLRILSEKHVRSSGDSTPSLSSPKLGSCHSTSDAPPVFLSEGYSNGFKIMSNSCLITSDTTTVSDDGANSDLPPQKKQRMDNLYGGCVPTSIITSNGQTHVDS